MDILHARVSIRRSEHVGVNIDAFAGARRRRCESHGRGGRDRL